MGFRSQECWIVPEGAKEELVPGDQISIESQRLDPEVVSYLLKMLTQHNSPFNIPKRNFTKLKWWRFGRWCSFWSFEWFSACSFQKKNLSHQKFLHQMMSLVSPSCRSPQSISTLVVTDVSDTISWALFTSHKSPPGRLWHTANHWDRKHHNKLAPLRNRRVRPWWFAVGDYIWPGVWNVINIRTRIIKKKKHGYEYHIILPGLWITTWLSL